MSGRRVGTIRLGGEVGNVAFGAGPPGGSPSVLVDVQSSNELASINPVTRVVERRRSLPGCSHDHGLALLPSARLGFTACDANATLLVLDLTSGAVDRHFTIGSDPDVLAADLRRGSVPIAAESGTVSVLRIHPRDVTLTGRAYWPLADAHGHPQLLVTTASGS